MKKSDTILLGLGLFTAIIPTLHLFLSVTYLFVATLVAGLITATLAVISSGRRGFRVIGISVCVVSMVGSYSIIAYESRSGKPVKIVLPADFQGGFSIIRDSEQGIDPESTDDLFARSSNARVLGSYDRRPASRSAKSEYRQGRVAQHGQKQAHATACQ